MNAQLPVSLLVTSLTVLLRKLAYPGNGPGAFPLWIISTHGLTFRQPTQSSIFGYNMCV